jgi:hypothetical protein
VILSKKNTPIPDPFEADELGIESNQFNSPADEIELEVDVWFGKNLVYIESQRPFLNWHNFNMLEGEVPTNGVFGNVIKVEVIGNNKLCGGISQLHLPPCPIKGRKYAKQHKFKLIAVIVSRLTFQHVLYIMRLIRHRGECMRLGKMKGRKKEGTLWGYLRGVALNKAHCEAKIPPFCMPSMSLTERHCRKEWKSWWKYWECDQYHVVSSFLGDKMQCCWRRDRASITTSFFGKSIPFVVPPNMYLWCLLTNTK